ncbi:hypothetical protein EDD17DRAFT_639635 [Pisolithus thermaeus]|nr:hypothetical protein EV401DRAFT_451451 [Pisolithus croceorrhizus]KAI6168746.1 hypothetical protein EDD17DRAFT_639635 [Pisolithus thermaeus]
MKRNQSSGRASSPTPTTLSGISNYRTDSYRPIRDQTNVPSVPPPDPKAIARTHYVELSHYLAAYLAKAAPNSRSTARQKLTRLTKQQFQELSTDVYDELIRRKTNTAENEVPCLPPREDFHPKRNQARQKLATLPAARFEDLSSDVFFELSRRYPEFKEEGEGGLAAAGSPQSIYGELPSSEFHASPRSDVANLPTSSLSGRVSEDRAMDSGYGSGTLGGKSSEDGFSRSRPSGDEVSAGRRSEDMYGRSAHGDDPINAYTARRKPSQDMRATAVANAAGARVGAAPDFGRRPSATGSLRSDSSGTTNAQSATATSGMIIPNKSTIAEEDIEVPFGREIRDSSIATIDDRSQELGKEVDGDAATDGENDTSLLGLSGLSARLKSQGDLDDDGVRSGDDYFDKVSLGRASVTSDRSAGGAAYHGSRAMGGRASVGGDEAERLRRDYEFKIVAMQNRIATLERDLANAEQREEQLQESHRRVRLLEEEIDGLRKRAEEHATAMRVLQAELDEVRQLRAVEKVRAQDDEAELQHLRDRCERLEEEHRGGSGPVVDEMIEQLRSDMESLMAELTDLGRRNDELMTGKEADLAVIRDLDSQLKEYKRRYEQAKTELRSVKATSQLFTQTPRMDDQLPMAQDGGLVDVHVTAFISSIDSLLAAARSNAPTRILVPMKTVVTSTSAIIDDVRAYESRPAREDVDIDGLRSLRERLEVTLSNLVAVSNTHATSCGMSPVSLLDAAASHVSVTVTEIAKIIFIRKAPRDLPSPPPQSQSVSSSTAATTAPLRAVEELRSSNHDRMPSNGSSRSTDFGASMSSADRRVTGSTELPGSNANSPPPAFDRSSGPFGSAGIDASLTPPEGGEDAWAELKPYLEAQTGSIVYAIQSILSGVRSPNPAPSLSENLTQVISIVSSIVAVCSDNLPPASAQQGAEILKVLRDHAKTLQDVQRLPEVTKESRQVMAKSSFAIANAMKGLMKL